jgi:predicted ATPase
MLARASSRVCGADEAMPLIEEALQTAEATAERWFAAELHRVRAACHLQRGDEAAAQADLLRALDLARAQQAAMWSLRAAVDLARLWAGQDREAEALAQLQSIYARFSEGLRTQDLLAARCLLADAEPAPSRHRRPALEGVRPVAPENALTIEARQA